MVATHSERKFIRVESMEEHAAHVCEFCGRKATFHSQNGTKEGLKMGRVVFHCQSHRKEARAVAERE